MEMIIEYFDATSQWIWKVIKAFWNAQSLTNWAPYIGYMVLFTILEKRWPIRPTRGVLQSLKTEYGFIIGTRLWHFAFFIILAPFIKMVYYEPLLPSLTEAHWAIQFIILLMVSEFVFYCYHVALHKIPFLWNFHRIHHSIEDVSAVNGNLRYHVVESALNFLFYLGPVLKVGFSDDVVFVFVMIQFFINAWTHCNLNWTYGKFNHYIVTTQIHQFHHNGNPPHDVNYGNMTVLFDKLFGSFYLPKDDAYPERLGLDLSIKTDEDYPYPVVGYWKQQLYPIRKFLPKKIFQKPKQMEPYNKPGIYPEKFKEQLESEEKIAPTISGKWNLESESNLTKPN